MSFVHHEKRSLQDRNKFHEIKTDREHLKLAQSFETNGAADTRLLRKN